MYVCSFVVIAVTVFVVAIVVVVFLNKSFYIFEHIHVQ